MKNSAPLQGRMFTVMRNALGAFLFVAACIVATNVHGAVKGPATLNLAGKWRFALDRPLLLSFVTIESRVKQAVDTTF